MARNHAVVIGASVAGLAAAAALAPKFRQVTVIDRDRLPAPPGAATSVPQRDQLHALLAAGTEGLDRLLSGFSAQLEAAGAVAGDPGIDSVYHLHGRPLARRATGMRFLGATRRLIEETMRQQVAQLPTVSLVTGEVTALVASPDRTAVTGVGLATGQQVGADLVVAAGGRASNVWQWLAELGAPAPDTSQVACRIVSVTVDLRGSDVSGRPLHLGGRHGLLWEPWPGHPYGAAAIRVEDRIRACLFGVCGEDPFEAVDRTADPAAQEAAREASLVAFADKVGAPEVADLLRTDRLEVDGVPVRPIRMTYPTSVRHHPERQSGHPANFIVTGDALCSFNPSYGQGMSVAVLEALLLADLIGTGGLHDLPARFYRRAARIVDTAWAVSTSGDLRFPQIPGRRTVLDRVMGWYLDGYWFGAHVDPSLAGQFYRVANMAAPARTLLTPAKISRVVACGGLSRRHRNRHDRNAAQRADPGTRQHRIRPLFHNRQDNPRRSQPPRAR